jgi:release factor glutamine methyltransferase
MSMMIKELIDLATTRFLCSGCLDPALDAEILLCHMLSCDKTYLFLHYADILDEASCEEYFRLMDIRAKGKPVQYITGKQEFMGLPFKVNRHVMIPRQDTETLAESALKELDKRKPGLRRLHVLDLCCGSGAIAVSVAHHYKKGKIKIYASDISENAVSVAKENAVQNKVAAMIQFAKGDLFNAFPKRRGKHQFDLIISNPPYIPSVILPRLMREVRDHEPMLALDGGPQGTDCYKRILQDAFHYLRKDGVILLEIGYDQAEAVSSLAEITGYYAPAHIIKDPAGHDRVAKIKLAL